MLSGLTIFLEHHDALLAAGIFPALMAAMLDAGAVPQAYPFTSQHGPTGTSTLSTLAVAHFGACRHDNGTWQVPISGVLWGQRLLGWQCTMYASVTNV